MPATEQLTVTLPVDSIEMIRSRVSSGEFANESEVIEALLMDSILPPIDETALERWVSTEGVRIHDAMNADPSRGLTSDEVFASLGIEAEETSGTD